MNTKYWRNLEKTKPAYEAKMEKNKDLVKVKLSQIDDIEDAISRGQSMFEFVEEEVEKAQTAFTKARDIVNFDMRDAYIEAEGLLDELVADIKALGIDIPDNVQELQRELSYLERLSEEAEDLLDNF